MQTSLTEIKHLQNKFRIKLLDLYFSANAGHIGCSLSCIDLLIGSLIAHKKPDDKFILSKGHAAAALYVCLNYTGEISDVELNTFYMDGTLLPAHPAADSFKGISFATGSLGHGFPLSAGIAKAKKLKNQKGFVYAILSDGETNEGTTWEAAHFSAQHQLDNLIVIIDKNGLQGIGNTIDILGDGATDEKWNALGFNVMEIDGHNIESIISSISAMKKISNKKPNVIIANTVKGKGISFMENKMEWHYLPMNESQYKLAKEEVLKKY